MEITEVRIKLMEDSDDRLQAFCSITFDDCFVVRDLKIIDGSNGPFVAMPSRKLTSHCPKCRAKNHLRSGYCNHCGQRLKEDRTFRDQEGRSKLYADIAHPINSTCREMIQDRVISEFESELDRADEPDYVSRYDDSYDDFDEFDAAEVAASNSESTAGKPATSKPATSEPAEGPGKPAKTDSERTHIEPAATEPRPPHSAPTRETSRRTPARRRASKPGENEFGAGIFPE